VEGESLVFQGVIEADDDDFLFNCAAGYRSPSFTRGWSSTGASILRVCRTPSGKFTETILRVACSSRKHEDIFDGYTVLDCAHIGDGMGSAFGGGSLPLGGHAAVEINGAA